ncbi:hypothetical protein GCM10011579_080190 [Streptomyces albiflavescens]|uniref:Uncharacterized protein n=1 Tax=Streptomyces albiflavescens TaxID=1623582 RepID=A0A917YEA8_9ACTN|nr:hypothetical protein GCM10011579_080190 [Streptomyces albiflavescens]
MPPEGGVVVPPRYDRGDWQEGDGVFNAAAIAAYTRRLADRIEHHVLAAVDGSADFRHPGNSDRIGAAGGEELALATGRGQDDGELLADLVAAAFAES